jgi:Lamin Tail Domain
VAPRRVLLAAVAASLVLAAPASAASPDIVISQVYGGGGNSGATLKNDFIELYNRGSAPVPVDGWSVQYSAATSTNWTGRTPLSGTIRPGRYYLVQEAAGAGGSVDLPTPNAIGTIAMAAGLVGAAVPAARVRLGPRQRGVHAAAVRPRPAGRAAEGQLDDRFHDLRTRLGARAMKSIIKRSPNPGSVR